MAYTVPDLRKAVAYWIDTLKVGPWYLAENFSGRDPVYRGEPCRGLMNVALGFAGTMQIELIELANDEPGIQRDAIRSQGYGFHHYGQACTNVEAERARYEKMKYRTVFHAWMPSGDEVYFMELLGDDGYRLVELISSGPVIDAAFTKMWESSINWAGRAPHSPI